MILMPHNKKKNDDCQVFYCFLLFVIVFYGYPAASIPGSVLIWGYFDKLNKNNNE